MCLEDRKLAYKLEKRSVSKSEQAQLAKRYRQTFPQLKLFGIGRVPVRWHRPIESDIKMVRIVCKAG